MKKIIILLLLIGINIQMSLASVPEPKWENIAPEEYAEAEYQINDTFHNKHPNISALGQISLVGTIPTFISMNKSYKIDENNYWAKRKKVFEEKKNFCKAIKNADSKMNCFKDLVQAEYIITAQRDQAAQTAQAIRAVGAMAAD